MLRGVESLLEWAGLVVEGVESTLRGEVAKVSMLESKSSKIEGVESILRPDAKVEESIPMLLLG